MMSEGPFLQALYQHLGDAAKDDDRALLRRALDLAVELHAHQLRKDGSTVLAHVLGVARTAAETGTHGPEILAAALLHDTIENTDTPLARIRDGFGPKVAALVDALTNRPGEDHETSVARAVAAGDDALLLRLCDRLDGARRAGGRKEGSRRKFLDATRQYYLPAAEERMPELARKLREAVAAAEKGAGSG